MSDDDIRIEPWSDGGLEVLRAANAPEMTVELGGPETDEKLDVRHRRYFDGWRTGAAQMFLIRSGGDRTGIVGYWETIWQDTAVYESGWSVLPQWQGRGIASKAVWLVVRRAAEVGSRRFLHAFPHVSNAASNGVCRSAGFTLEGEHDFEYPPGNFARSNDWRIDLRRVDAVRRDDDPDQ